MWKEEVFEVAVPVGGTGGPLGRELGWGEEDDGHWGKVLGERLGRACGREEE